MQITACLALAKHLRDPTFGINAMIAGSFSLWTEGGVGSETHTIPEDVAVITSPFDDGDAADRAARFEEPASYPALYVLPDGPVELQGEVATRLRSSFDVAVVARYLVSDATTPRFSARNAAYTMELISKSMKYFLADDLYGRTARSVRGQHIQMCNRMAYGPWREKVGAARAIAIFAAAFEIRNEEP